MVTVSRVRAARFLYATGSFERGLQVLNGVTPADKEIRYFADLFRGQILRSLALGLHDSWVECALVRPVSRGFPPEPFRFLGAHLVRGAVRRRDTLEHAGQRPDRVTAWLAGLAPSGVTPSKANIEKG